MLAFKRIYLNVATLVSSRHFSPKTTDMHPRFSEIRFQIKRIPCTKQKLSFQKFLCLYEKGSTMQVFNAFTVTYSHGDLGNFHLSHLLEKLLLELNSIKIFIGLKSSVPFIFVSFADNIAHVLGIQLPATG